MSTCPCGHSWSGRDCTPPEQPVSDEVTLAGKLYRIRQLLDKRAMDPYLRQEFLAVLEHGEGCDCYYCLGPRPGISPPPLEITG